MNNDKNELDQILASSLQKASSSQNVLSELAAKTDANITEVKALSAKVNAQADDVAATKVSVSQAQAITFFGFIIALITLVGVVVALVVFAVDTFHQNNEQTLLLQEIHDKLDK
jgi:hypothetical protein